MFNSRLGSKDIAQMEKLSQRAVNYMKDREGFPSIEWIGRTWRVNRDDYEAWKALKIAKRFTKND